MTKRLGEICLLVGAIYLGQVDRCVGGVYLVMEREGEMGLGFGRGILGLMCADPAIDILGVTGLAEIALDTVGEVLGERTPYNLGIGPLSR